MRSLITSITIMLSLIVIWLGFFAFSGKTIASFSDTIENDIIYNVKNENWEYAETEFAEFKSEWDKYRNTANFFLSSSKLNEIDGTFVQTERYIETKELSDALSELAYLQKQLSCLYDDEKVTFANIL